MKLRKLTAYLAALLLLAACNRQNIPQKPVSFYYPKAQIEFGTTESSIGAEKREGSGLDTESLLNEYFEGPAEESLINPFPKGVRVISLSVEGSTAHLVLTDAYASLDNLAMSMANGCLVKTTLSLTGAKTLVLSCKNRTLNSAPYLELTEESVLFTDHSKPSASTPAPEPPK